MTTQTDTVEKYDPAQRYPKDPFTAFRFKVSFDGDSGRKVGGFSDVSGLVVETEIETLREGGVNSAELQLAGATKFSSRLTLKRGMADQEHLWNWYQKITRGEIWRRDVCIELQSTDGKESLSWTFLKACPVKWTGPELHAATSAIAFESIELVHQGLL